MRMFLHCFAGVALLVAGLGCGGDGLPTRGTVSGTVTYRGSPLKEGTVVFDTKNGFGTGAIDEDGTYTANVPLGEATIAVTVPPAAAGAKTLDNGLARYQTAKTSGLKTTIKSGKNELNIELK